MCFFSDGDGSDRRAPHFLWSGKRYLPTILLATPRHQKQIVFENEFPRLELEMLTSNHVL